MNAPKLVNMLADVPAQQRLAMQSRLLRGMSILSQIVLMVALLVLWKQFKMPFSKAFERCFVCGIVIYVALGTAASILLTIARLQPIHILLRQVVGIVSVLIFCALRYVYGLGVVKSVIAWLVIYIAARVLVRRIENRAMQRFQVRT